MSTMDTAAQQGTGIYIHVPFCLRKCPYCDFYSLPLPRCESSGEAVLPEGNPLLPDQYTDALIRCMEGMPSCFPLPPADSLYIGGGTPTLLGPHRLCRLVESALRVFGPSLAGGEITLEANPGTVDFAQLRQLRQGGFNRISFGVQSAVESELEALGRMHSFSQAARAVEDAARAGFENISVDLMLGIPGQTAASALRSADACLELPIRHLSAYLLKVEEGTPFARQDIASRCPDEDLSADIYEVVSARLEAGGLRRYEISNFARPGWESRHNLKYWLSAPYLGLGPSAHSFAGGRRLFFPRDLEGFVSAADPLVLLREEESPEASGTPEEFLMLRLRLTQGVLVEELRQRYPRYDLDGLLTRALELEPHGLCTVGERIALTGRGFLLSNSVIARLLGL